MSFILYVFTVVLTNVAFLVLGPIPIGFGLMAPAAVLVAGFAFVARDYVHERYGIRGCLLGILLGTVLSATMSPQLALASGCAFLFSELADLLVFSRLRARGFIRAAAVSNVIGLVLDSLIFLLVAFGSLAFLPGQLLGKAYATLAFLAWAGGRAYLRRQS